MKFIIKYAKVKTVLILFGLVLLFNLVIFPLSHSGNKDLSPLDIQISYSPEKAYEILDNYSETDRRAYIIGELTIDLIYPIVYSLLLCFIIFLLYKKPRLAAFPLLILISDYLENFGIVTLLSYYPQKLSAVARVTGIATSIKWFLVGVSLIIILYGLGIKIYRSYKKT